MADEPSHRDISEASDQQADDRRVSFDLEPPTPDMFDKMAGMASRTQGEEDNYPHPAFWPEEDGHDGSHPQSRSDGMDGSDHPFNPQDASAPESSSDRARSSSQNHEQQSGSDGFYENEPYANPSDGQESSLVDGVFPPVPPANHIVKNGVRLTSTGKPSHARKVPANHIKRPRNAFILFRSHACMAKLVPEELGINDHRHISRIVGNLWKSLPPEEKRVWEEMAEKEKEEHKKQNPEYKYRPVYRREGVVRRRRRKPVDTKELEDEERKCEVVAKVLLEGGPVDEQRLESEIEVQKEKDEVEGRKRAVSTRKSKTPRSRSQSRAFEFGHLDGSEFLTPQYMHQERSQIGPVRRSLRRSQPRQVYSVSDNNYWQPGDDPVYGYPDPDHAQMHGHGGMYEDGPQSNYFYDGSLMPPSSDPFQTNVNFGIGASQHTTAADHIPETPRTIAIQQYMSEKMGRPSQNYQGDFMSLRPAAFDLPGAAMRSDAMLVSPIKAGFGYGVRDERGGSFDPSLLDHMSLEHDGHGHARRGHSQPPDQGHYDPSANYFEQSASGQLDASDLSSLLHQNYAQHNYSAFGELAASATTAMEHGGVGHGDISLQPDQEVQYVYLSREQASDAALVEAIRAQGLGITFDGQSAYNLAYRADLRDTIATDEDLSHVQRQIAV